jgi:hypothetical protein
MFRLTDDIDEAVAIMVDAERHHDDVRTIEP